MNNSQKAYNMGQSLWYDNIQRKLLKNGELARMISDGEIYGVTSNPSIFNNAITKSDDYDADLLPLLESAKTVLEIFEELAVKDIQDGCDLFAGLYRKTNRGDGYVSLEVNPDLANDTEATVKEATRLWKKVNRPNLMVKIPATLAGIPAIEQAIAAGLNINVTLIFSQERYEKVMDAYLAGLEQRFADGLSINGIASVASFFVSRMDSKVDKHLQEIVDADGENAEIAASLMGKSAIANAKLAYQQFMDVFASDRFKALAEAEGRYQRPLWASTSTKNPAYPDTLYVDTLIGPNTVNTTPPSTLTAFLDHGTVVETLQTDIAAERQVLEDLETLGISIQQVTQELEDEGVSSFSKAFNDLLDAIESRRS